MDVLNYVVNSKEYRNVSRKICNNHPLADDLHCEIILVILEKKYDLDVNTNLKKFFATLAWLTWHSNKFKKKYFTGFEPLENVVDEEGNELEQIASSQNDKVINYDNITSMVNYDYKNDFELYEKNLLRIYVELGDCRAVSRQTNIPYRTVANDIKTIKDNLKKAHNAENTD